jgi:anti-sigma regulatory factor (Ser/Thr protein kinase)
MTAIQAGGPRLDVTYPATPNTVPAARQAFVDAFPELSGSPLDDGKVVLTELVTNGIRHGAREPDGWVRVVVHELGGVLRIEVTDSGDFAGRPVIRRQRAGQVGGWGLLVVDNLAMRWGVTREGPRTVWCELVAEA